MKTQITKWTYSGGALRLVSSTGAIMFFPNKSGANGGDVFLIEADGWEQDRFSDSVDWEIYDAFVKKYKFTSSRVGEIFPYIGEGTWKVLFNAADCNFNEPGLTLSSTKFGLVRIERRGDVFFVYGYYNNVRVS